MSEFPLRFSSVAEFLGCPRRAAFRYMDRQQTATTPRMALGTVTHAGIERALRLQHAGLRISESELERAVNDAAAAQSDRVDWSIDPDERGPFVDRALAMARHYVEHVAPSIQVVDVERWFETEIGGYRFTGQIDVVEPTRLRDVKTKGRAPTGIEPRDRLQLGTYAIACEVEMFDTAPTSAVIDALTLSEKTPRKSKADPFPVTTRKVRHLPILFDGDELAEEKEAAKSAIVMVAESAARGDFPRNPLACEMWGRLCDHAAKCIPHRASAAERRAAAKAASEARLRDG